MYIPINFDYPQPKGNHNKSQHFATESLFLKSQILLWDQLYTQILLKVNFLMKFFGYDNLGGL